MSCPLRLAHLPDLAVKALDGVDEHHFMPTLRYRFRLRMQAAVTDVPVEHKCRYITKKLPIVENFLST